MPQDEEHLRLLAIFHCIVGGLAALFSFFPLLYGGLGLLVLHAPAPKHGDPPPPFLGWLFIGVGCFFFVLALVFAACLVLSGRFIAHPRHYWFTFVLGCIQCLFFPFGVVLGVFTIIVLSRRSVKELFGVTPSTSIANPAV
jgi:hypothetical protein